jgi:hypothetical protein
MFSIHDAPDLVGRELFPSELDEEHKARRGLISEHEWLAIKDPDPGAWWRRPRAVKQYREV